MRSCFMTASVTCDPSNGATSHECEGDRLKSAEHDLDDCKNQYSPREHIDNLVYENRIPVTELNWYSND